MSLFGVRDWEEIYVNIDRRLRATKEYDTVRDEIKTKITEKSGKELFMEISDLITRVENCCHDAAYNQGYSDAIKLLMACMR
jgi:predicted Co/Zn/Cd cation transporter (cation efflux family)